MEIIKKIRIILSDSRVLLILIFILGLALRLINLGIQPYWGDEVANLTIIRHYHNDPAGIIEYFRQVFVNAPLYCLMLFYWTNWFGFGEFAVRLLSVVFGLGLIVLSYFSGKIIFKDKNAGLFAALIVAFLPMLIEFSQQARPYIFFCFFGLLAITALWQYFEKKKLKYLAVYAAAVLFGLYLHYSFIILLLAIISFWFFKIIIKREGRQAELVRFFAVNGLVFIGFYWWLGVFLMQCFVGEITIFGVPRAGVANRSFDFFDSLFNQLIWLSKQKDLSRLEIGSILLFKVSLLSVIVCLAGKLKYSFNKLRQDGKFYLVWIFLASAVLFLISPQSVKYTSIFEKHIIAGSVIFALLFAVILAKIDKWKVRLFLLVVFLASILNCDARVLADDSLFDPDYSTQAAVQYINQNYKPGDIVLIYYGFGRDILNYYLDENISAQGIYPLFVWDNDLYYSRYTLGFLENEFQLRIAPMPQEMICNKIDYIIKKNHPGRIWIYGPNQMLSPCFSGNDWRTGFSPITSLFPITLYVKK